MDQRPEQIEQHIRHQRSELEDNFSELEEKVKGAFDWKTQFEERPGIMLGAAFVGGVLLAAILPSTSSITRRVTSRRRSFGNTYVGRDSAVSSSSDRPSAYAGSAAGPGSETWDNLKNAAIGLGVSRLTELVEDLVPGFSEQYKKAASSKPATNFGSMPTPQETSWQKPNGGTDYASHS